MATQDPGFSASYSAPPRVVAPPRPSLARRAWRLLVAVKDALALLFLLLFFGLIFAALSGRPQTGALSAGALHLDFDGTIVEQPEAQSFNAGLAAGAPTRQYRLRDVLAALDRARTDASVKAVVLDLDGFLGAGQVSTIQVGEALDRVRAAKPVFAYATAYTDDSYMLAAHATQVWMDPMGAVALTGPGGTQLFFKGLLDRIGATVHVYRVGKFKAAVEPFTLDRQSPESREANTALAGSLWTQYLDTVQRQRPRAKLAAYAADPAAAIGSGSLAEAALAQGLVDRVADRATFDAMVAKTAGAGKKGDAFAAIPVTAYIGNNQVTTGGSGDIGVVTVAGDIVDGEAELGTAGGDTIAAQIDKAVANKSVRALILRVDSPGGSALASERIRLALVRARAAGIPVTVSMANVAASGGYWVATAADKVFAEPSTITGSIGVFGVLPTFEKGLAKIGVTGDGVATTPLTGQPDLVRGTNPAFDALSQRSVETIYARFLSLVSGARRLPVTRVDEIAQGRVWDGGTARQFGLIDAFGGFDDALADAAARAKVDPKAARVVWLEERPGFEAVLAEALNEMEAPSDGGGDTLAPGRAIERARAAASIRAAVAMVDGASIQARCLSCPLPPAAHRYTTTGFLGWIASIIGTAA